ncbi:hypothetical protein Ancab_013739 [Ancistrocladus abbreviatus]
MADGREDSMNLDLNLGPVSPPSSGIEPSSGGSSLPESRERFQLDDRLRELLGEVLFNRWGRQSGGSSETQAGLGPLSGEPTHSDEVHLVGGSHDQTTSEDPRTSSRQLAPASTGAEQGAGASFEERIQLDESSLLDEPDFTDDSFDHATREIPGNSSRPLGTALLGIEPGSAPSTHEPSHFDGIGLLDEPHLPMDYGPGAGEFARGRMRHLRWEQAQVSSGAQNIDFRSMVDSSDSGTRAGGEDDSGLLPSGEGSAAAEERNNDISKSCENIVPQSEDKAVDKKEDVEKGGSNDGGFFDCNICLDLAREPVVTCCGHLFCWPCIYRWLSLHSDAKECPVCKGEVTLKNVTPIYGRGNSTCEVDEDLGIKIPVRPPARPVESLRQAIQRTASSFPMDDIIRRLDGRYDVTRDLLQQQDIDNGSRDGLERGNFLLNRILTSRGLRREQNMVVPAEVVVDLAQDSVTRPEVSEHRRLSSLIYRRSHPQRVSSSSLSSVMTSGERFLEASGRGTLPARSQEQPPSVDDRDSFSSIAAVIHGESQTLDTAVEIDSMVSLSTSSSRQRNDASRVSIDSEDSRAPRRRRLN